MIYDKVKLSKLSMPNFSKKKLLLIGFLFIILLVIPLTVYLVGQQQELRSRANPNTTLSFVPAEATASVGAKINFDVWVAPGSNQVNFIKLVVKYDGTKLSATEESFVINPASNLSILQGPVVGEAGDDLSVILSIESDPTKVIQQDTKVGTITFDVTAPSDTPTQISFDDTKIEIRSLSGANQDAFDENVFLNGVPATLTIQSGGEVTPTPTAEASPSPSPTIETSPTPTSTQSAEGATPSDNQAPVCESLVTDRSPDGAAPLSITFTVNGSDTDGTISKATFSFGDGTIEDETTGGGIGTDTVNIQKAHTYNNAGAFTASALLTDDGSGVSDNTNCTVSVSVTDGSGGQASEAATPLPATGPTETIVGAGLLGGVLFIIGALLFFAL
ncbi:MAG: hypothetical protein HY426_03805 [Candidatus Levybacteria bacterium]|nr:hypothetical protein [Candidatus Levybacteria bacterium]